jgi:hypothetical protein
MASDELEVTPTGLRGGSGIIAGHAGQVLSAAGSLTGSAELSGVAAGAVHGAFDDYCAAFSQRLSSASAALMATASLFTAMENTNSQALASIAPGEGSPASEV